MINGEGRLARVLIDPLFLVIRRGIKPLLSLISIDFLELLGCQTLLSLLLLPPFGLFLCALSLPSLDNLSKLLVLDCCEHLDGFIVRYWNIRSFICRL